MSIPTFRRRVGVATLLAASLGACTWVEPDAGGRGVQVAYGNQDLGGCRTLGTVTVSVKHTVAGIARNPMKVRDELESLARNEAATLRASHVQALGEPADGEQSFRAYDCR